MLIVLISCSVFLSNLILIVNLDSNCGKLKINNHESPIYLSTQINKINIINYNY